MHRSKGGGREIRERKRGRGHCRGKVAEGGEMGLQAKEKKRPRIEGRRCNLRDPIKKKKGGRGGKVIPIEEEAKREEGCLARITDRRRHLCLPKKKKSREKGRKKRWRNRDGAVKRGGEGGSPINGKKGKKKGLLSSKLSQAGCVMTVWGGRITEERGAGRPRDKT